MPSNAAFHEVRVVLELVLIHGDRLANGRNEYSQECRGGDRVARTGRTRKGHENRQLVYHMIFMCILCIKLHILSGSSDESMLAYSS